MSPPATPPPPILPENTASGPQARLTPRKQQRRRPIKDVERKALREYYSKNATHKPSHAQLRQWFFENFHHRPSQSTISESLSATFAHLDSTKPLARPDLFKHRECTWPDLEDALFDWQQRMIQRGATVTGDTLKEVAAEIWGRLPQYAGTERPKLSTGWLNGFKARYSIRKYRRHGEAGAADQDAVVGKVTHAEALLALASLRLYEEQQENGDSEILSALTKYERVIKSRLT